VYRIDADGEILTARPVRCTTHNQSLSARRFSRIFAQITPGDMIYGLMRAEALEKAGALSWQLMPDRLTLMLLSFYGSVLSVPEYLWYRRYRGLASVKRQIQSSFPDRIPPYLYLPWWINHAAQLFNKFVLSPRPLEPVGRWSGAGYSLLYALLGAQYVFVRRFVHPLKRILRALAPAPYAFLKAKYSSSAQAGTLVKPEHHSKVRQ
jgi:hypothetical protein